MQPGQPRVMDDIRYDQANADATAKALTRYTGIPHIGRTKEEFVNALKQKMEAVNERKFLKVIAGIEEPDCSEHEVQLEQASWTEQLERIHGIIRKDQHQKEGAFAMMNPAPMAKPAAPPPYMHAGQGVASPAQIWHPQNNVQLPTFYQQGVQPPHEQP